MYRDERNPGIMAPKMFEPAERATDRLRPSRARHLFPVQSRGGATCGRFLATFCNRYAVVYARPTANLDVHFRVQFRSTDDFDERICVPARDIVGTWYFQNARHGFFVGLANDDLVAGFDVVR